MTTSGIDTESVREPPDAHLNGLSIMPGDQNPSALSRTQIVEFDIGLTTSRLYETMCEAWQYGKPCSLTRE